MFVLALGEGLTRAAWGIIIACGTIIDFILRPSYIWLHVTEVYNRYNYI